MKRTSALQFPLPLVLILVICPLLVAETHPGGATPIAEAVKSFNETAAKDPIGRKQQPLTEDEIIAAIKWWKANRERMRVSGGNDFQAFLKIAETRQLPLGWGIEVLSGVLDDGPLTFEAWSVGLRTRPDERGSVYIFQFPERTVRPRLIGDLSGDAGARQVKLEAATKTVLSAHHFSPTQVIKGSNGSVLVVGPRPECWSGFVIAIAKMNPNGGVSLDMEGYQFVGSDWARLGRLFMERTNREADEIQAQIQEQLNRLR